LSIRRKALLLGMLLLLSFPSLMAAHPGGHDHSGGHEGYEGRALEVDWSAYPADIQVYKGQLDQLRAQQRGLFEQFKHQRLEIRSIHKGLTEDKRKALKNEVKDVLEQLRTTRDSIHVLRDQKQAAWVQFHRHGTEKKWDAAKADLQTVVARKQEIIARQRTVLQAQQTILDRMKK
jgi:hypothetical protein